MISNGKLGVMGMGAVATVGIFLGVCEHYNGRDIGRRQSLEALGSVMETAKEKAALREILDVDTFEKVTHGCTLASAEQCEAARPVIIDRVYDAVASLRQAPRQEITEAAKGALESFKIKRVF